VTASHEVISKEKCFIDFMNLRSKHDFEEYQQSVQKIINEKDYVINLKIHGGHQSKKSVKDMA
jgi:FtsZ-interacting cell division protein YlmF